VSRQDVTSPTPLPNQSRRRELLDLHRINHSHHSTQSDHLTLTARQQQQLAPAIAQKILFCAGLASFCHQQSKPRFTRTTTTPQPFYGPFSMTSRVSRCHKRTSGLYGARED